MNKLMIKIITIALSVVMTGNYCYAAEITNESKHIDAKKAILVVSTGTTDNEVREKTTGVIQDTIASAFPEYEVKSAYSNQSIIKKIEERDGVNINDPQEAIEELMKEQVKILIVQPTYMMNGSEYDTMKATIDQYKGYFDTIQYGAPLLSGTEDYEKIIHFMKKEAEELTDDQALVYMGHGTEHFANAAYAALDYQLIDGGQTNIIVGTLESYPSLDSVVRQLKEEGYKKVSLKPFLIVTGVHAQSDMAGDDDSWKVQLSKMGFEVECEVIGLGEYPEIQQIYVKHIQDAILSVDRDIVHAE